MQLPMHEAKYRMFLILMILTQMAEVGFLKVCLSPEPNDLKIHNLKTRKQRLSFVGEVGWELHCLSVTDNGD